MITAKKFFDRTTSFFPPIEVIGITSIIVFSLLLRVTRLPAAPFASDESLYSYASYAISQGAIPYREIQLAHPPFMYLLNALFIRLSGPDLTYLRLWAVGINLANVFLVYLMVKVVLLGRKESGILGLLSAGIYAFYPVITTVTSTLEAILTFFMLLSIIFYAKSYRSSRKTSLFLSGIFMGSALMTKLPAIFFIAAVLIYHLAYALWHKERRRFFELPIILLGMAIPIAVTLILIIFFWGAFNQFYMQVFNWQVIRPPQLLAERYVNIFWYARTFLPLIAIGALSLPYFVERIKKHDSHLIFLPAIIYIANIVGFLALSRFILFHYFIFLSPFLVFLDAIFVFHITQIIKNLKIGVKPSFSLVFLLISVIVFAATIGPFYAAYRQVDYVVPFVDNPYAGTEYCIGHYVAGITNQSDKIWTSEGGIAFFAQRLIATPNSSDWPVQSFFDDMFNVLSPSQFVQTWENEKTKVVIFILGKGWIPYPDGFLWFGTPDSEGVGGYVQEKYELKKLLVGLDNVYTYEIWVRR
jgi:4-amino-4-deoxy-L-arabinose transferase-like glycosyltransferase